MKSEEIAVLRILYKHKSLVKLSALIAGFPDESRSRIIDAVANLQLQSFLNMTEISTVLYVSINRQARRTVLELLKGDSAGPDVNRILKSHIQLKYPSGLTHANTSCDTSIESDLKTPYNNRLWPRLPQRLLKLGTILVCTFAILGSIAILNSQSTTSSRTYVGYEVLPSTMFTSSSSPLTETEKGKTISVEHVYNLQPDLAYSGEQAVYEGIFTKLGSQPTSADDPPLYYHYIISEKKELLLLEQIHPAFDPGNSNTSLSAMSGEHGKEISTA